MIYHVLIFYILVEFSLLAEIMYDG